VGQFKVFSDLGLSAYPLMLAPLAGVSDHPFRRVCALHGADLTFVEMLSATALLYGNQRTFAMMRRHEDERVLGVQVTGRSPDEIARAVAILDRENFDVIDINMGCPVRKVVQQGCGSALLKDPEVVFQAVKQACQATGKPLSVKVRLGWDRQSINIKEVADAVDKAGAAWLTVHGRTRADDYGVPVDLGAIRAVKAQISLPVIGNGNLFQPEDARIMLETTGVDGLMISRGALGDPWVFRRLHGDHRLVTLDEWHQTVLKHLGWQQEEYGSSGASAICMRKHVLWYTKGWPGGKRLREQLQTALEISDITSAIDAFAEDLAKGGVTHRCLTGADEGLEGRFNWDPKWDMHRQLDRGVNHQAEVIENQTNFD